MQNFDTYTLWARVFPVAIVLVPVVVFLVTQPLPLSTVELGSIGTVVTTALGFLLAQFGRSFGKRKESELWRSWGGPPTTRFLRHRDAHLDPTTTARYHRKLHELSPDVQMPTSAAEADDAIEADKCYQAATRLLIAKTRDAQRFPLVFKENKNYGFLRNLWGLKPIGLTFALALLLVATWWIIGAARSGASLPINGVIQAVVALALCALFLFWVRPESIRIPAEAYADRLLEALDVLVP